LLSGSVLCYGPPPASDGVDRETRCVVVDSDAHPSDIVGNVIDAVGRGIAEFRNYQIVHALRANPWLAIHAQLLFLRADRNRRLICGDCTSLMQELRESGTATAGPKACSTRDRSNFLSALDLTIVRLKRKGFGTG
jgi:hypothetical protein